MRKRASTIARAKTNVKAKEAARLVIMGAKERTPARVRASSCACHKAVAGSEARDPAK
jgi:hypothetical protein